MYLILANDTDTTVMFKQIFPLVDGLKMKEAASKIPLILICSSFLFYPIRFSLSCLKKELLCIKNTRFTIEYKSLYSILSDFLYKLFEKGAFMCKEYWIYYRT